MRTYDLTPLFRSTVGFERMSNLLNSAMRETAANETAYPPYNIEKIDEDTYRITLAVAGFDEKDLEIEVENGTLTVSGGTPNTEENNDRDFLYRGIAGRSFERRFQLADHIKVTGAEMDKGLLHVELVREIPEAMKPRKIEIGGGMKKLLGKKDKKAA